MFKKVLIANRGAISTRIIRTLKQQKISSVAVYAECDADSLHVREADETYSLGDGDATETYLNVEKLLAVAEKSGVDAIHPGYGFLSENAEFVLRCEAAGIIFIGPTSEQIITFGLKHKARALAESSGMPLLPGSELLRDKNHAQTEAEKIGYPVMLKSTAGGGGIGMQLCSNAEELADAYTSVKRLGASHFADDGIFLEKFITRARHIEVQMFGDGQGQALAIGERDCSSQRRNQKVLEECPAPGLNDTIRSQLYKTAERLLGSVNYRNAGTVEFIFDSANETFYFLEVNTRLQVEHGVTEAVYDIDLVEWMLRQAAGETINLDAVRTALLPRGHAIQARIYAEDPYRNFQPSPGLLTDVYFPEDKQIRIDTWIESGMEIPPYFDPMLAKVIVHSESREQALELMQNILEKIRIYGTQTNLEYLKTLSIDSTFTRGLVTTRYLNSFNFETTRIDILQGGTQTTIQDYPGRTGYWDVGVPPSGPFDNYSFRLANRLLNNQPDSAALEITLQGPTLTFSCHSQIVITGAQIDAQIDDKNIPMWTLVNIKPGQVLAMGRIKEAGTRAYLAVSGGIRCPDYLDSKSTFTLGQFGGHNGRALSTGDVLNIEAVTAPLSDRNIDAPLRPEINNNWTLDVIYGPHGAPEFFTRNDIDTFFSTDWEVHYNSSRTGIRLIGPRPEWARANGGEAGMHPSNIHDNAYAFGTVDFTGDMPVILGPDGPSLGGFVCPATVIQADLWKLGQLRAGDKIRFRSVKPETAVLAEKRQQQAIETLTRQSDVIQAVAARSSILDQLDAELFGDEIIYRTAGDHFLLVEYGEKVLDIRLRFRVHALMQWLQKHMHNGIRELTPGIRSLQIHYNSLEISATELIVHLKNAERALSENLEQLNVPSRIIHLPLSWDDEACHEAIAKYMQSVRENAPWCPSNLEFIRRINGLDSIAAVKQIIFSASYLVMGLGDVYLGAPVATPLDPRHRLVTTKYNPARTWTAENSVGIGGSYMCIYGMEGPGGYQFVGRTLQMWNRYRKTREFSQPWLLRFFDQIRFYEVSGEELKTIRRDFPQGRYPLQIEESSFSLADYSSFLEQNAQSIQNFNDLRNAAFDRELEHWHETDQFNFEQTEEDEPVTEINWPEESTVVASPITGSIWKILVATGDEIKNGDVLLIVESMKMEFSVKSPCDGRITHILAAAGNQVKSGQTLIVLEKN